jgi:tRNA threonylcarbamoyladenosine biosynthesis protein TsaB
MNSNPVLLSIETATLAGSIAISRGSDILAACTGNPGSSHSNTLLADIDELLSQASLSLVDIDFFAVAAGPGSFTGLRIGIATVKALAATTNRQCIAVPSLAAIAHSAGNSDFTVPVMPAGRGEVFAQSFEVSEGQFVALDEPGHMSPRSAIERYDQRGSICWTGAGAHIHANLIKGFAAALGVPVFETIELLDKNAGIVWRIAPEALNLAQHVASLALGKLARNEIESPTDLRALYVRPSDAELNA